MKPTWLATGAAAIIVAVSSSAFAADLPVYKAYAPAPAVYKWTGFYAGANIGGAWASGTLTDNVTGASISGNSVGLIGGGTMGYNWQFAPNWLVGVEGMFDGMSISKTSSTVNGTYLGLPVSIQGSASTTFLSTVAARIGYVENNWLFYAKGGGGWANDTATVMGAVVANKVGWVGGSLSALNTSPGWLVGAGIEYGLTPNSTLKIEYDYVSLNNYTATTAFAPGDSISVTHNFNLVTIGMNYKF